MLGSTVPTVGGLPMGFRHGDAWGCECIQIYVTLSRKWEVARLTEVEIIAFKEAWQRSSVKQVVAHVPYLVNVATPDAEMRQKSLGRLYTEFERADQFGVPILILHPGGYKTSTPEEGLYRIVDALDGIFRAFPSSPTRILLETMAGQGTMLGARFEEIAWILSELEQPERSGVCFDTSHVFSAGYDIRGYDGYATVMEEFDRLIGVDRIGAFHANDSKVEFGSRHDRHAWIGEGVLGLQTFHALVRDKRFKHIPMVLEMPDFENRSKENLDVLKQLRKMPANRLPDLSILKPQLACS